MKCLKCGSELELFKGKKYVCSNEDCDFSVSKAEADSQGVGRGKGLLPLIPKLPSTLAIMLDEYVHEENDYIALHRICGALEITVRFLIAVTLADVRRQHSAPDEDFPESLLKKIYGPIQRPTLGMARELLRAAVNALPGEAKQKNCLLPQLLGYAGTFIQALSDPEKEPLKELLTMRNLLAHGGRLSDDMVTKLLKAHEKRFEELMCGLTFLSEDAGVKLVALSVEGDGFVLCGLAETGVKAGRWPVYERSQLPEHAQQEGEDRMLLVTPDGVLDLFPLQAYGEVFQVVKNEFVGQDEEAIHVYLCKADPSGANYTALDSRSPFSRGAPPWQERFEHYFRFEEWQTHFYQKKIRGKIKRARYTFERRMDDLLQLFIGRDQQVAAAAARIDAQDAGILWLGGKPGMGKSAFMAKLVHDCFQKPFEADQPQPNVLCIPYFFQTSESDLCRTGAFTESVILQLNIASGKNIKPEDNPTERIKQFKKMLRKHASESGGKILFFVDGLDEIASLDVRFIDLIFDCQYPHVLWVCAGRDEEILLERFKRIPQVPSSEGSRDDIHPLRGIRRGVVGWFFECDSKYEVLRVERKEDEGLLPPLKAENVRGFLIEELGHRNPQLFKGDRKNDKEEWTNVFIQELVKRSDGLPLYLRLLVEDIRNGRLDFSPGSEQRLPHGLEEYYDRIIEELGDDVKTLMPVITSLLALAKEPLSIETLIALLSDLKLVSPEKGQQLLKDALRRGRVMLRRAPTAKGVFGYELYHTSFRQHVLCSSHIELSRAKGREYLCTLAMNWRNHERDSLPCDYAMRFGPIHLAEAKRWDDLVILLTRWDELNLLERWTEKGYSDEGLVCLKGMIAYLRQHNRDLNLAAGLFTSIARIYSSMGKYRDAEQHLEQALKMASEVDDKRICAIAYHELGNLYSYRADTKASEKAYLKALDHCGDNDDDEMAANLLGLAEIKLSEYQYNDVIRLAEDALQKARKVANIPHIIAAHRTLANVYTDHLQYDKAEDHLQKALILAKKEEFPMERVALLYLQAWMYYTQAIFNEKSLSLAAKAFENTEMQAKQVSYIPYCMSAKLGMAWCAFAENETEKAHRLLLQAEKAAPEDPSYDLETRMLLGWASLSHQCGDFDTAVSQYKETIELSQKYRHPAREADALVGLGAIYWHKGLLDEAKSYWGKATVIATTCSKARNKLIERGIERSRVNPRSIPL